MTHYIHNYLINNQQNLQRQETNNEILQELLVDELIEEEEQYQDKDEKNNKNIEGLDDLHSRNQVEDPYIPIRLQKIMKEYHNNKSESDISDDNISDCEENNEIEYLL